MIKTKKISFNVRSTIVLLTFLFFSDVFGQPWNNWTFDKNLRLDFNYDPPKLKTSKANNYGFNVTLSDNNGDLLIYTDIEHFYNGEGDTLHSLNPLFDKVGVTYNARLLLDPKNPRLIYFVCPKRFRDGEVNLPLESIHRLYISTIKVEDDNTFNILDTAIFINELHWVYGRFSDENIFGSWDVTYNHDRTKFWIAIFNSNDSAFVYSLDSGRVNLNSKYLADLDQLRSANSINIDFSNTGRMIMLERSHRGFFYLLDFDTRLGKIKEQHKINDISKSKPEYVIRRVYEFGPKDKYLFFKGHAGFKRGIYKYDLRTRDIISENNAEKLVDLTGNEEHVRKMRLAPDGNIYLEHGNFIYWSLLKFEAENKVKYHSRYIKLIDSDSLFNSSYSFNLPKTFYYDFKVGFTHKPHCANGVSFKNLSDTGVFNKFTWYFQNDSGFYDSTEGFNAQKSWPAEGKYKLKLKAENEKGWTKWYFDSIYYKPSIQANFKAEEKTGCQWKELQFQNETSFGTGKNLKFQWEFGDGTSSSDLNPDHVYEKAGTYNVTLIAKDSLCSDTIVKKKEIEILPAPNPEIKLETNTFCVPDTIDINEVKDSSIVNNEMHHYRAGRLKNAVQGGFQELILDTVGVHSITRNILTQNGCDLNDSVSINVFPSYQSGQVAAIDYIGLNKEEQLELQLKKDSIAEKYEWRELGSNYTYYTQEVKTTLSSKAALSRSVEFVLSGVDYCGEYSAVSAVHNSLFLHIEAQDEEIIQIGFTPYRLKANMDYRIEGLDENLNTLFELKIDSTIVKFNHNDFANYPLLKKFRIKGTDDEIRVYSNLVNYELEPQLFIPTAFTPNNDGLNDAFQLKGYKFKSWSFSVYNKWGQLIFKGDELTSWRAENSPPGRYLIMISGTTDSGKPKYFERVLTLIK